MISGVRLCDPVDCSPPGSSVHGILQARILEWVAVSFSRGTSWPMSPTLWADASLTELRRKLLQWSARWRLFPSVLSGGLFTYHWVLRVLKYILDTSFFLIRYDKGNQSWIFIGRNWCWSWNYSTLATWCKELTPWKRPWCWERLRAGGEGDDRGWDGWMASPTQWTWVWVTVGVGDGQGGLACCSPWGHKEWDTTELYANILLQSITYIFILLIVSFKERAFLILKSSLSIFSFKDGTFSVVTEVFA